MNGFLHHALLASGRFFFRVRNILFPLVLLALVLGTRPALFLGDEALDHWVTALGVLCIVAGQSFRLLVIGFAYIRRGGKDHEVFANELVTRGFYRHTRNPMYVGNFTIVVGLCLIYGSPWAYVLTVAFFAWVYLAIVTAEEDFLRGKFGAAFEQYTREVNRFIPDLRGIQASLAEFTYDWRRALVKEYNTLTFNLAAMFGLLAWKIAYLHGYEGRKELVLGLGAAVVPLALFYVVVRSLKKTRRLRPARKAETEVES
jgi:protein-S-isoprenylcysteine O-methyltransferase Ste14